MNARLINAMPLLALLLAVVAGCQPRERQEKTPYNRLFDPDFSMPEYAARAIEAAGGRQAWTMAENFELDCVVIFYQADGSFYLTEQHHQIHPWKNSIRISAAEPQGQLVWQLSRGSKAGRPAYTGPALPGAFYGKRYFAELILDVTTAPLRLLDEPAQFSPASEPVKMAGRWYQLIERADPRGAARLSKAVFYQNTDNSLIDMVSFPDADNGRSFMVRAYDHRPIGKDGVAVPGKVEIFESDDRASSKSRLAQIDYDPPKTAD